MAREKLGQFLKHLDPESSTNTISYTHRDEDNDLGRDPESRRQLMPDGQQNPDDPVHITEDALLSNWVAWLQENQNMNFRVGPDGQYAAPSNRGENLAMAENQGISINENTGKPRVFVTRVNPSQALGETLTKYSNSGKFDSANPAIGTAVGGALNTLIDKSGIYDPDSLHGASGDYLLSSVEGGELNKTGKTIVNTPATQLGDRGMPQAATRIVQDENRFRPGPGSETQNPFIDKDLNITSKEWDSEAVETNQREFGSYDKNAESVTFEQLKKVGLSLMIQAAGYAWDGDPGHDGKNFADSLDPDISGKFPEGTARDDGGVKVQPSDTLPRNTPTSPSIPGSAGNIIDMGPIEYEDQSYGAFNTPNTPFAGPGSHLMPAQAAAALLLMGKAISNIEETITKAASGRKTNLGQGPFLKGESSINTYTAPMLRLIRNLLLVPTQRPYGECVSFGTEIIFGNLNDFSEMQDSDNIAESAGYYLSVARSVLRSAGTIKKLFSDLSAVPSGKNEVSKMIDTFGRSRVLGMLNTIALIGNIGFIRSGGSKDVDAAVNGKGPFDVDKMPDSGATRVMKSRSGGGFTNMALSWRGSSLPAIYMIPKNVMRASIRMGTGGTGTNPLKGMLVSSLANKTYIDMAMEGVNARIPGDIVERMENLLDAEYVPFYFHDLRTNEIVTFHAFLNDLTDSYDVNHTKTGGYGRIDPVLTYNSTTRSIGFTFYAVATSQEDFDEMWFKINKLTTMVYPQWTKGITVEDAETEAKFTQPFSQVLGSSPIIRLRIGDVIKSNYSKFHLARVFGIGEEETNVGPLTDSLIPTNAGGLEMKQALVEGQLKYVFANAFGSPLAIIGNAGGKFNRAIRSVTSQFFINGFANPLTLLFTRVLRDPDTVINTAPLGVNLASVGEGLLGLLEKGMADASLFGYHFGLFVFIKPTTGKPYTFADGSQYMFSRPIRGFVVGRSVQDVHLPKGSAGDRLTNKSSNYPNARKKTIYTISIVDFAVPAELFGRMVDVTHSDVISDPNAIFNTFVLPFLDIVGFGKNIVQGLLNEVSQAAGVPIDQVQLFASDEAKFMSDDNAIVKSFNATRGRGLAGAISSLNYTWIEGDETTWETDWNSRAPKIARIRVGFAPIHDIPPGLGHDGFNRAPIYNVGRVMRYVAGDPYDDDGAASKFAYDNANRASFRKVGEDTKE
jgi:hypothetical protein